LEKTSDEAVQDMNISIVTPSFNQACFIQAAIESVRGQGYPRFEHIILDNCSTDGTVDLFKKYPHLNWVSQPDQGQSDALNSGFRKAAGEVIGWLNADDRYLDGCFNKVAEFFSAHPHVDVLYGDYRLVNEKGEILQWRRELNFDSFMLKYLHVLCVPSTTVFFRRRIFDEGNFLDTSYHYSMDYEFFLRLVKKGYKFAHLNEFLADFRWHETSKSSRAVEKQRAELKKAQMEHDSFLKSVHPRLRPVMRFFLMVLARGKRCFLKGIRGFYFSQWVRGAQ